MQVKTNLHNFEAYNVFTICSLKEKEKEKEDVTYSFGRSTQ